MRKIFLDESKIRELYVNQKKSARAIGKIFNVNGTTISRRLKKMNIKVRQMKLDLDLEKIQDLYIHQRKSGKEIGRIVGGSESAILQNLKKVGIKKRRGETKKIHLELDKIKNLYVNQRKTIKETSQIMGVSKNTIFRRLKELKAIKRDNLFKLDLKRIKKLYSKGLSTDKIAKVMNTNQNSINRRLKEMEVKIKSRREYGWESYKVKLDERKIKDLYVNQKKSIAEIGKIFGVSKNPIIDRLKNLGIKIREGSEYKIIKLDLEKIKDLYVNKKKSIIEIGELFGVNAGTIFNRLKEEGINMYVIKRKNQSLRNKKLWADPGFREKQIKLILEGLMKRPTSFEQKLCDLCLKHNLPFIYTGNGKFLVGFKNPDFKHKHLPILIEVYNDFHHPEDYEEKRGKHFVKYGYKTIFINQQEVTSKNWENICLNKIQGGLK